MKSVSYFTFVLAIMTITMACGSRIYYSAYDALFYKPPNEPWRKYDRPAKETFLRQQYDMSEYNYLKKIEMQSKTYQNYYWLSRIYWIQGRYNKAVEARKSEFQIDPNRTYLRNIVWLHRDMAEFYMDQGKFDLALENLEKALSAGDELAILEPHNAKTKFYQVYSWMGSFYIKTAN